MLPFWNAIVLGGIVGMHFVYVDFQNSNLDKYYLDSGHLNVPLVMKMFFAMAAVVACFVFIVEILIHGGAHRLAIANRLRPSEPNSAMTKLLSSIGLPALDAIFIGGLLGMWFLYQGGDLQHLRSLVGLTTFLTAFVFIVELIMQQIVRAVTAPDLGAKM
jgi:hypothetical protein